MFPRHINPVQYSQAIGYARSACARIFRDGGSPADALETFQIDQPTGDWSVAVERIAQALCAAPQRKAA